ncbi:MAG: sarcosine oxidase subunit gamma [Rhizobiaceae bacterium]
MANSGKIARRSAALEGRMAAGSNVQIVPAAPAYRLSLRASAKSVNSLSKAVGLPLPSKPKSSAVKAKRSALWLGPDEWLIIDESDSNPVDALSKTRIPHAAVDISHRNTGILVSGSAAEATLSSGCPQDLRIGSFPVGACSRTVLGKAEIVLWRIAENEFRVECWRSFSTYVFDFLELAARDAAA